MLNFKFESSNTFAQIFSTIHINSMPEIFTLPVHTSAKGDLTVFENILPGSLKRIFYITNADCETRGGHRHVKAWQALICLQGTCEIYV